MKSLSHLLPLIWAGLCVLNPTSSLKTKKLKSYLNPIPVPTASSLKSLKKRDLNSKLVRRRGRVYVINKTNPKFKARQK